MRRARERGETENADSSVGCSLEAYASEKRFPVDFLEGQFGLREKKRSRIPTLEIPYCDQDGNERALRYRHALTGAQRFSWRRGDTPCLYGLQHLEKIRARDYVIFVEGESDTQTGRYYDFPVLGVPGSAAWKDGWAPLLNGLDPVYLVVEPDAGGSTLLRKLTDSALGPRLKAVRLGNAKDLSALHLKDPSGFAEILQGALRIHVAVAALRRAASVRSHRTAGRLIPDAHHRARRTDRPHPHNHGSGSPSRERNADVVGAGG